MEAGDAFVAERLASLPEDLVTLALHGQLLVLDVDETLAEMRGVDDDEGKAIEKALSNRLSEDVDQYKSSRAGTRGGTPCSRPCWRSTAITTRSWRGFSSTSAP